MAGLSALLALLDDPEVTEVVLTSGQPVTTRQHGGYQPVGTVALSADDIGALIEGTALGALLDAGGASITTVELEGRPYRAEVNQFGPQLMVRVLRGPSRHAATSPRAASVARPATTPRAASVARPATTPRAAPVAAPPPAAPAAAAAEPTRREPSRRSAPRRRRRPSRPGSSSTILPRPPTSICRRWP
ncbi:MAG: hypothetical protein H6709_11880 [Kofleriaceae bacterium]|nr:hypothetical protein [Kofleriaceae bacterium]